MKSIVNYILLFKYKRLSDNQFVYILSIVIGIVAGIIAVSMKNLVHYLHSFISDHSLHGHLKGITPVIGILITVLIAKYILKVNTGHGIPKVLYAISRKNGALGKKSIISSSLFSVLTVGFGGSAGLEGPSASVGAAIGSKLSRIFHLEFTQVQILIGCGSSAAIAAIFNTPIAAILFSLEILMLDLTIISIIPLLLSSVTGLVVSYFLLGQETIYQLPDSINFNIAQIPIFIILGIIAGLNAAFFSKIYIVVEKIFENIHSIFLRVAIGGILLYILYFFFPASWGEGYEIINMSIENNTSFIDSEHFAYGVESKWGIILLILIIIFVKIIATNITFGMGGVGGIFAPSLFIGATTGLVGTHILYALGFTDIQISVVVLVAMSGFMTGILHAPLTGIFLIAELTNGYEIMVPLIITSVIAYLISKKLTKHSVYTFELAKRNELLTHNKNKSILAKIDLASMLENDFQILHPDDNLFTLVEKIQKTKRNVFPVTDNDNYLVGVFTLDDAKQYIFNLDKHIDMQVREIMYPPRTVISLHEKTEAIVKKIHATGRYNIPVLDNGKYAGFISRANIFSKYQKEIERVSNTE